MLELGHGEVIQPQDLSGVNGESLTTFRQSDFFSISCNQSVADHVFETFDLQTDRRLRPAEDIRCLGEARDFYNGNESS